MTDQEQSKQASPMPLKLQAELNYSCINLVVERKNSALHFLSQSQRQNPLKKKNLCKGFAVFPFISFEIKAHKEISLVKVETHKTNSSAVAEFLTTDFYGS